MVDELVTDDLTGEDIYNNSNDLTDLPIYIQTSPTNEYFDQVIGHIEDIVVDDDFKEIQKKFFEEHWEIFENTEENKLEYMDIFCKYTNTLENYLTTELSKKMEFFDMKRFTTELQEKKQILEGEIFDLLLSFSDFTAFKELMLDYRAEKEGRNNIKFDIIVTRLADA